MADIKLFNITQNASGQFMISTVTQPNKLFSFLGVSARNIMKMSTQ